MIRDGLFHTTDWMLNKHSEIAGGVREFQTRDWILSAAVLLTSATILGASVAGFVSAADFTEKSKPIKPCQQGLNVALQRSLSPKLSILENYSEMGMPIQLYVRMGTDFSTALNEERTMRALYGADILLDFVDPKRSLTEGEFIRDFNQKCRMVLYYP